VNKLTAFTAENLYAYFTVAERQSLFFPAEITHIGRLIVTKYHNCTSVEFIYIIISLMRNMSRRRKSPAKP